MKVAVTGASGLIGSALVPALRDAGHDVVTLVRRAPAAEHEIAWDPAAGTIDAERLAGIDAVVHLAGETIGQRWSSGARERIRGSRVDGTGLIARTLAALEPQPAALVQASGVGYYGLGDEPVTEESPKGAGFAADVVEAWEAAAEPGASGGHPRRRAAPGADPRPARGSRRADAPAVQARARRPGRQRGPVVVLGLAPGRGARVPPRARDRSRRSGERRRRLGHEPRVHEGARARAAPADGVPPARVAVRLAFGQMGEELLLGGQRPVAERLERAGFAFHDTDLDRAMAAALAS